VEAASPALSKTAIWLLVAGGAAFLALIVLALLLALRGGEATDPGANAGASPNTSEQPVEDRDPSRAYAHDGVFSVVLPDSFTDTTAQVREEYLDTYGEESGMSTFWVADGRHPFEAETFATDSTRPTTRLTSDATATGRDFASNWSDGFDSEPDFTDHGTFVTDAGDDGWYGSFAGTKGGEPSVLALFVVVGDNDWVRIALEIDPPKEPLIDELGDALKTLEFE
jgi:hypothetical protein